MKNKPYQGWTIITDCDGTLTDGKKYVNAKGERETIAFHSRDSVACRELVDMGFQVLIVSDSGFTGIYEYWKKYGAEVIQEASKIAGNKLAAIEGVRAYEGPLQNFDWAKTIGIGDDLTDACFLQKCKYPCVVKDAHILFSKIDEMIRIPIKGGRGVLTHTYTHAKIGSYE